MVFFSITGLCYMKYCVKCRRFGKNNDIKFFENNFPRKSTKMNILSEKPVLRKFCSLKTVWNYRKIRTSPYERNLLHFPRIYKLHVVGQIYM